MSMFLHILHFTFYALSDEEDTKIMSIGKKVAKTFAYSAEIAYLCSVNVEDIPLLSSIP